MKICTDAGFLKTVEIGQYLMTRHTYEFLQCAKPVTCREYTLPRDESSTDPKRWIRVNTKIGPVLEVTTSCLQGKYGVEIGLEPVNKDNCHSWVRVSHGLNTFGHRLDRQRSMTTTSRRPPQRRRKYLRLQADQRLKQNREDFQLLAHLQELYVFVKEYGLILNQEFNSINRNQWQKD